MKEMSVERKAELYDNLLGYLVDLIGDDDELKSALEYMGFTREEIRAEI